MGYVDTSFALACLRALAPPPRISPSEFAEREIVLPPSSNAIPGPLRLTSYQREIVEAFADDDVDTVVLMVSAQTGKSLAILAMLGYAIACDPGPMMHFSPAEAESIAFVRERLNPLIDTSPILRRLIGRGQSTRKGSTGGINALNAKSFPGGQLSFGSSHKRTDVAARAIRYLLLDEIDKFAENVGGEGDPLDLAIKRTTTYEGKRRKIVLASTPTGRDSRINAWYMRGDRRQFHVKCPDCEKFGTLEFAHIHRTPGKPETAAIACAHCGVIHSEATRLKMIDGGKWVPTAQGEPGVRSYHMNALSSRLTSLSRIIRDFEAAKTPENKQAFYNTTLAQPYEAGVEVELSPIVLEERAEAIRPPYAADIQFVVAGVDVQRDRVEVTFLGQHADGTASVLQHVKLSGDTSGDVPWSKLDEALGTTFALANGRVIGLLRTAIDTGAFSDRVAAFVHSQRRKSRTIFPIKGVGGFDRPAIKRGGRLLGQMSLYLIGVDRMKDEILRRLNAEPGDDGRIRLPDHLDSDYFNGLASEELVYRTVRGTTRREYRKTVRQNEPLDCLVYAAAIAKSVDVKTINKPAAPTFDPQEFAKAAAKLNGG